MENNLQIDIKFAYDEAMNRLYEKEKEIVQLRALCNQLANEVHRLQHELGVEH